MMTTTDRFGNRTKKGITPGLRLYTITIGRDGTKYTTVQNPSMSDVWAKSQHRKSSATLGVVSKGPTTRYIPK